MADNDLQEVPLDGDETTTTTTTATIGLHDDSLCLSLLIVALGSPAKRNESVTRSSNVANRKESDETRSASASATTSTAADEADDGGVGEFPFICAAQSLEYRFRRCDDFGDDRRGRERGKNAANRRNIGAAEHVGRCAIECGARGSSFPFLKRNALTSQVQ